MVRSILLPSVATLALTATLASLLAATPARADDGGPPGLAPVAPGLTLDRAASDPSPRREAAPLPRWEAHLGGGLGAARVAMLGADHGSVAMSIDLEAIRWSNPHTGFGLYVGELFAEPWHQVEMDSHPVSRDLPWMLEPEVVHRSTSRHSRWLATGWTASIAAGAVVTRTSENWSHLFSKHVYSKTLEHGVEAGTTLQLSAFVHAGPVAVAIGPRASADTAGDLALTLEATAGASW
ncbi:MAG: hypothetical protein JO257_04590 [Deltaproteobacteria bacterium]|nr:hypothetical protein [Deltaproteobacteria bacterium]